MDREEFRLFCIDGDTVSVKYVFDTELRCHRYDYPDFKKDPRITPTGRPWVNAIWDNCPHASGDFGDCGSCSFYLAERHGDLIGVCTNKTFARLRKEENE